MQLKDRIMSILEDRGMSQAELSRASGISTAQIAHIVTGRTKDPAFSCVVAIAKALDVSLDFLAGRDMEAIKYSDNYKQRINDAYDVLLPSQKESAVSMMEGLAFATSQNTEARTEDYKVS